MAADDTSGAKPAPVVLRIKLRYDDVEAMVQRFAPNAGKSGLFLPTKSLQPVGSEIKFELRLNNDTPVLVGLGRVKAAREPDPTNPKAAFGMAIELMRVTREGRDVIMRMLERRRAMGLAEVAIPMPSDIDQARRAEVDTGPTHATPLPPPASEHESAPIAVAEPAFTAPRRPSTPMAIGVAKDSSRPTLQPLAPEAARPKRPRISDVVARAEASGGVAVTAIPELDQHVDLERAMARARALAGGDLDAELGALREHAAAPIAIDVEAASAELAKQLGGRAIVRKDRGAGWATPPESVATPVPVPVPVLVAVPQGDEVPIPQISAEPDLDPEPSANASATMITKARDVSSVSVTAVDAEIEALVAAGDPEAERPSAGLVERPPTVPPPSVDIAPPTDRAKAMMIDDDSDLSSFEDALDAAMLHSSPVVRAVAPNPEVFDDDDAVSLDSMDLEEEQSEMTEIGGVPGAPILSVPADLGDRLDAHLADAEAEAEAEFAGVGNATIGEAELPPGLDAAPEAEEFDAEEISDFDVLAEADADDADLLSADGEADASGSVELAAAPAAPDDYDFADHLDLGEDAAPQFDERHAGISRRQRPVVDEQPAADALPRFDHDDQPSSDYTLSEALPNDGLDFDEPHFRALTPLPTTDDPLPPGAADYDLDSALEHLDPNLDQLAARRHDSEPNAPRAHSRASRADEAAPRPARAVTDDGVLIDFDDDD